jgi:hypothetical protein
LQSPQPPQVAETFPRETKRKLSGYSAMHPMPSAKHEPIPATSLIFGYGPMLPLVVAAVAIWVLQPPWPEIALRLALIWAAAILIFVAGVRRGYGFGSTGASTPVAITTMLTYFVPGSLALVMMTFGRFGMALAVLIIGFALVAFLDRRAAMVGDAPTHFARLRVPQMAIAVIALVLLLVELQRLRG